LLTDQLGVATEVRKVQPDVHRQACHVDVEVVGQRTQRRVVPLHRAGHGTVVHRIQREDGEAVGARAVQEGGQPPGSRISESDARISGSQEIEGARRALETCS
jgi:hypothetical protein